MINIVTNTGFTSDFIVNALKKTGDFRVTNLTKGSSSEIEQACRETGADILLMNIGLFPVEATVSERIQLVRRIRKSCPKCKIALLVDENIGEIGLNEVIGLRQAGLIDSFLYFESSMEYLVATMKSICV